MLPRDETGALRAETAPERRDRMNAHHRLTVIENIDQGFTVVREIALMGAKHRARARTLWNSSNRPAGSAADGDGDDEGRRLMNEILDRADRMRGKPDAVARVNQASSVRSFGLRLAASLPISSTARTWRRRSRKDMKFRFVEVLLWAHVTQVDEFCVEESKAENPISELLDHTWRLAFRTKSAVDPNV